MRLILGLDAPDRGTVKIGGRGYHDLPTWMADGNPSWLALLTAAAVVVLVAVLMVTTGTTRALAAATRQAAGSLAGEQVAAPPPPRPRRGLAERLRNGPGWRAMAYLMPGASTRRCRTTAWRTRWPACPRPAPSRPNWPSASRPCRVRR